MLNNVCVSNTVYQISDNKFPMLIKIFQQLLFAYINRSNGDTKLFSNK